MRFHSRYVWENVNPQIILLSNRADEPHKCAMSTVKKILQMKILAVNARDDLMESSALALLLSPMI